MDRGEFCSLAASVSQSCLVAGDRIGNLLLRNGPADEAGQLKEPQLRHVWASAVDQLGGSVTYSFECPTTFTYQFSGQSYLRGRTDLVLYSQTPGSRRVLIELKYALSAKSITQDLVKLMRESADPDVAGCAVMFVTESTQRGIAQLASELPKVVEAAWSNPHLTAEDRDRLAHSDTWFELMAVVRGGPHQGSYRAGDLTLSSLHPFTWGQSLVTSKDWSKMLV